jgi:triacylglycerol lipase
MGQSAGAVHVAGYVADQHLHVAPDTGLAGALMISGSYDVTRADVNQFHLAYYGENREAWPARSTLEGLVASRLPLFFSVSEFDGADFQQQAALLVARWHEAGKGFAPLYRLARHNHLSPAQAIGTPLDALGPLVREFVATTGLKD